MLTWIIPTKKINFTVQWNFSPTCFPLSSVFSNDLPIIPQKRRSFSDWTSPWEGESDSSLSFMTFIHNPSAKSEFRFLTPWTLSLKKIKRFIFRDSSMASTPVSYPRHFPPFRFSASTKPFAKCTRTSTNHSRSPSISAESRPTSKSPRETSSCLKIGKKKPCCAILLLLTNRLKSANC